jgi:hypothetical protein
MNLKDIINYRNNCPICDNKLILNCKSYKSQIYIGQKYLLLKTRNNEIKFYFDNKYEYKQKFFKRNIKFSKQCINCSIINNYYVNNIDLNGIINSTNITNSKYLYLFNIELDVDSIFNTKIIYESFNYCDDTNFYGMNIDFVSKNTVFLLGKITHSINEIKLHKFNEIIDMTHMNNLQDLNKKVKMLSLFL